jgi:Zn-dependent protease
VQFNEQNLRNPKTDVIKIAVAGPLSNAITAMILSILFSIYSHFTSGNYTTVVQIVNEVFIYAIYINWGLFIFNLIPLPPLDGSHLLLNVFRKFPGLYEGFYKYGSWIFFGLIIVTVFTKVNLFPIWPAMEFLGKGFLSLVGYS